MISFMLAMDRNRVIGLNNDLPWHLPKDFRFFKERTSGHTVIMGRKTYDSLDGALPNRKNVVVTRKNMTFPEDVEVITDLKKIPEWNKSNPNEELFVIGGGNIFKQVLPYADRMYITFIDETFDGDAFFPEFNEEEWNITSREKGEKDDKNPYDYYFLQYDRK
ncbi:dihydrofolate reductase [Virgibacillus natechei]|uniref:dihydrofolate reductase n=1 Tax=Virgibacillus sp. CBA3643 TaxID=2942278 RepID=UPI0035A2C807